MYDLCKDWLKIAGLLVAILNFALALFTKEKKRRIFVAIGILVLVFVCVIFLFICNNKPTVNINSPPNGRVFSEQEPGEQFLITVTGTYEGSLAGRLEEKIYVIVCPRLATACWPQFPPAILDSNWSSTARLGGTGDALARNGEEFDILAIVTGNNVKPVYEDLRDLPETTATSQTVRVIAFYPG